MRPYRPLRNLAILDADLFGCPRTGAAYLIRAPKAALVETGTASSRSIRRATLGMELRYIFLTHVHLDHAGAAGHLSRLHPRATVVVHPLGVPHLIDPRRLVEGTKRATGRMFVHYGEPLPIEPDRVHPARDGESFDLGGGRVIEALFTPGHAPHHVCYVERGSGVLFAGDALGNYEQAVDLPLTVPPGLDRAASDRSFDRLRRADARAIAYAHFGIARGRVARRIDSYQRELHAWLAQVKRRMADSDDASVVAAILNDPKIRRLDAIRRASAEMCVRGAILTLRAEAG